MTVFKLPDLGEGLSEAEVLRWHVQVGDRIEVDAPMLAVETAKAVVEVPSPVTGVITALHASPGDRIEIGAALVEFAVEGAAEAPADSGTVVGHMPAAVEEFPVAAAATAAAGPLSPRVRAVPAARALARSLGLDPAALTGSGSGGLITLEDVLAHAAPRAGTAAVAPLQPPADAAAEMQELRGLRRAMAQSMSVARDSVCPATVFDDAELRHWSRRSDYSVRVLRAIAFATRAEPALNAWYDPAQQRRWLFRGVDVGIAVDTPDGLIVPVMRSIETRDTESMRAELERLKRAAHERTLSGEQLRNSTFMLSNFGTMAGRYATPVVVPPAVAILGTGRVRESEQWRMPLSLSFDHRAVTGGEAVRFLAALIADLELPQ